jgi:hypothetical protein
MIDEYVTEIAKQMGIQLSQLSIVEGQRVGCHGLHLMNLACDDQIVSTLVFQADLDKLQDGSLSERLQMKIVSSLSRLQKMISQ